MLREKKRFIYYLLLVDNEPDHRRALLKMHSKTYAIFTSPETESILQPTRGYFTFQVLLRNAYYKIVAAIDSDFSDEPG